MLDIEKLVKHFNKHEPEKVRVAGAYVNKMFPDAKGYPSGNSPDCIAFFISRGAVYNVRFSNCKICFASKKSKVLNPLYWYNPHTKEVDFSKKLRRDHIVYRKERKDSKPENWKVEAKRKAKEKKERVDELLIAARSNQGLSFNPSGSNDISLDISSSNSTPLEQQKQPVKIESLSDIRKINKEKKRKPKKAKPKKAKPKSKTKGIW